MRQLADRTHRAIRILRRNKVLTSQLVKVTLAAMMAAGIFVGKMASTTGAERIVAPSSEAGVIVPNYFGQTIAASGNWLLIGWPYARVGAVFCEQGTIQLFADSSAGWRHIRRLAVADIAPFDWTGYSVALSPAGLVVGAPESNDPVCGSDETCSVIRFERSLSLFLHGFETTP